MKLKSASIALSGSVLLLLFPLVALGAVTVQVNPIPSITQGTTALVSGVLTNQDQNNPVYLTSVNVGPIFSNGQDLSTLFTIDNNASFSYLPLSLNAGQVYPGPLFFLPVSSSTPGGVYTGTYTLMGGASTVSPSTLATASFTFLVTAGSLASTTPSIPSPSPAPAPVSLSGTSSSTDFSGFVGLQVPSSAYANGPRLIQLAGDSKIYWVNAQNYKIQIPNESVLESYGQNSSNAQSVGQDEFDFYPVTQYIRPSGNARIYKVTNAATKQFIPSSV